MEVELIVVRVGHRTGNVLHDIHRIGIQVNIIFLICIRPGLDGTHQLVGRVVRNGHQAFRFENDFIRSSVVNSDMPLRLKVVGLLLDVLVDLLSL